MQKVIVEKRNKKKGNMTMENMKRGDMRWRGEEWKVSERNERY